jgi:fatty-acid desaturase
MFSKDLSSFKALWLIYAAGQGVTMGAHRLWSHRAFKAKRFLKIFLLYMHTLAGQNCLWVWVRDHRQHHKYRLDKKIEGICNCFIFSGVF